MMFPAVCQAIQQGSSTALKDLCAAYTTIADCNLDFLYLALTGTIGPPDDGPYTQNPISVLQAL